MVTFTSSNLITSIKRTAHVPQGNSTFLPADFLAIADLEMRTRIAPKIASCRENYWMTTQETVIDNSSNTYYMPSLALGGAFVDIKVKSGTNLIHLIRLEVSDLYSTQFSTLPSYGYYLEDQKIKLIPNTLNGSVVLWYYRIPSQIVPTTDCAQIESIADNVVTCTSVPSDFTGGGELDIVSAQPGFNVLLKDTEPVSIAGNDITFTEVPETVEVGDWVCLSGQSCVIQAPLEWVEVLVQACAVKIYEIQGYDKKHALAKKVLEEMMVATTGLVSPRTIESNKVIAGGGSLLSPMNVGWSVPVQARG
jgi:hypothetical protein